MTTRLIHGSAHNLPLPDKSIHAIMTSPPYWGLRVYDGDQAVEWPEVRYKPMRNLPEIVIPGCDPNCDHDWQDASREPDGHADDGATNSGLQGGKATQANAQRSTIPANTCRKCGGWRGGLGNEPTPEMYIGHMMLCLREWGRVLRDDGVVFVNLGDSYAGSGKGGHSAEKLSKNWQPDYSNKGSVPEGLKPKDLVGIPHMFVFAAQADGWYWRSDIVWSKRNSLPESVTDRPTRSHEYIFMLAKSRKYFFDHVAIKEPLKESSILRVSQDNFWNQTGGEKDYANGVNSNRSMRRSLENFAASNGAAKPLKFGGNKEYPDESGANKRDVWFVDEEGDPFLRFLAERGVDVEGLRAEYEEAAEAKGDVWRIATKPYKGAHFAAWPEDLVRPMILSSTSAHGVCPACGAPWERVVEKVGEYKARWKEGAAVVDAQWGGVGASSAIATGNVAVRKTTGWRPTCNCVDAGDPIPATVLDPFSGSGTTLRVATQMGRDGVGVDICEQYLEELAPERVGNVQVEFSF